MSLGLGGFQETEQLPIFSKITKYQAHINRPERMAELSSRAFDLALAERGPAQINIPRDYFYGEFDYAIPQPMQYGKLPGPKAEVEAAAKLLAEAKFPVIVSGGGVIMANAVADCAALAERLNAPVVNSYLHNDSFPANHPLWAGPLGYQGSKAGMKLIMKADVVLALGTRLGPFGTLPQHGLDYWPKNAKIIQVDADHRMLGLVKKISVGVQGDSGEVAKQLLAALDGKQTAADANKEERLAEIKREKEAWESELNDWTEETDEWSKSITQEASEKGLMHPRQALRALEKAMPEDAMVSTDIGNICSVSNSYLRFNQPRSFYAAMSFGNCGYALPTIMGAKMALPQRPAVAYVGDGAWGISFGELLTCMREEVPVTAVVFNNRQWGAEKKNQVDFYGTRFLGSNIRETDWSKISSAMGAHAVSIRELSQVGDALAEACEAQKQGRTTVLEVHVTRELGDPFRRDALKQPARTLAKYKKFE
jgi:sulfoacetaldehyde acetyltransferase